MCSFGHGLREGEHAEQIVFFGGGWRPDITLTGNREPAECPKCHRLFPLAKPRTGFTYHQQFVTFHCNRPDPHPDVGEHWTDLGAGARFIWTLTKEIVNGVWLAKAGE